MYGIIRYRLNKEGKRKNRVLMYKKHSAGIMYMVLTVIGLGLIATGITRGQIPLGVIGVPMTVLCAILSYRYLLLPSNIIELSDENTLILPGGEWWFRCVTSATCHSVVRRLCGCSTAGARLRSQIRILQVFVCEQLRGSVQSPGRFDSRRKGQGGRKK